jgi:predicted transposase YbfD/YdcC
MVMKSMGEQEVLGIIQQFEKIDDPRSHVNRYHLLVDVIVISICAVLAGADGPTAIEKWAIMHTTWLKKHLRLPHGIPSHDTIGRVLGRLRPLAFQNCFAAWIQSLRTGGDEDVSKERECLAIDGKTLRRSHDRRNDLGPLHLVSVWATQRGITLGQLATEEKSNEITAIPQLLDQIDVKGAIVTIDAAGCQKKIAQKIIDGGGDYAFSLKGNQDTLFQSAQDWMAEQMENDFANVAYSQVDVEEVGHGRKEHRTYIQCVLPKDLRGSQGWAGLRTIGVAIRTYEDKNGEKQDVRYFISSLKRNGKQFARAIRGHWGIENTLHWSLDMTFREDESRIRDRNLTDNIAWLRRFALTLIKQHPGKDSMAMKRRMAGWNVTFLTELLTGKGA